MMNNVRLVRHFFFRGNHFACVSVLFDLNKQPRVEKWKKNPIAAAAAAAFSHSAHAFVTFLNDFICKSTMYAHTHTAARWCVFFFFFYFQLHHCFIRLHANCVCVPLSPFHSTVSMNISICGIRCSTESRLVVIFSCSPVRSMLNKNARIHITHEEKRKKKNDLHWQNSNGERIFGFRLAVFFVFFSFHFYSFIFICAALTIFMCIHLRIVSSNLHIRTAKKNKR